MCLSSVNQHPPRTGSLNEARPQKPPGPRLGNFGTNDASWLIPVSGLRDPINLQLRNDMFEASGENDHAIGPSCIFGLPFTAGGNSLNLRWDRQRLLTD